MGTTAVRVLLCCLVVVCGLGVGLTPVAIADSPTDVSSSVGDDRESGVAAVGTPRLATAQWEDEPSLAGYDEISVEIDLYGNGSAAMTFEYRYRLDDGNESVDWEELRQDVENRPDAYLESFEDRREETLAAAENQTGRNMSMTNFSVETDERSMPSEHGYVRFTFHWSSFAHVEVARIEAGDALEGFTMTEETQLLISWPEEYENASVVPEPDEHREKAVMWYGEETREFVDGEPRLELLQTGGEPVESPEESGDRLPISWIVGLGVALLVLLSVVAAGVWLWPSRGGDEPVPAPSPPSSTAEPDEPAEPSEPPLELLSNEERVMRLLEMRGGRIKQQEVVSELDWTEAKTSQVVSGLRESGKVDVFRIGRENVLSLPDDESDEATTADDGSGGTEQGERR